MSTPKITAFVVAVCTAAAPVLPLLVNEHVLSASEASTIGGFLVSFAAAWHGNSFFSNRPATTALEAAVDNSLVDIGTRVEAAAVPVTGGVPVDPASHAQPVVG